MGAVLPKSVVRRLRKAAGQALSTDARADPDRDPAPQATSAVAPATEPGHASTSVRSHPAQDLQPRPKMGDPPRIYPRDSHGLSRKDISEPALKVLYRLHKSGYRGCLVGGGVRDVLLGLHPKDFDIATDAHPEDVEALFRNCRLIGRRFRLAHVRFGPEIVEVATFRAGHDSEQRVENEAGRLLRDNVYGTLEDDVWRRDFTVNALYYDIADFSIIDYVGGMADLEARQLRMLGDPEQRYREDPVRMLRAVRLAEKLDFEIEAETRAPIPELAYLLGDIAPARLFDECCKLFQAGAAVRTLAGLRRLHLFGELFPATENVLATEGHAKLAALLEVALTNTDRRVAEGLPITPAFLFAALLWPAFRVTLDALLADGVKPFEAYDAAADAVITQAVQRVALPRRFSLMTREIWVLQLRLENRERKRVQRLVEMKRFRAAYDFLVMRSEVGDADPELARWWTEFQTLDAEAQESAAGALGNAETPDASAKKGRRRRRPRRRPRAETH